MPEETLNDVDWRIFRLFLSEINDAELDGAYEQLQRELACREERQSHALRLLFGTMPAGDLQRAGQEIVGEQAARTEDRRFLAARAAARREADHSGEAKTAAQVPRAGASSSQSDCGKYNLQLEAARGMDVMTRGNHRLEGETKMKTSTASEPAPQAAPAGKDPQPKAENKAKTAPRKPRVAQVKGKPGRKAAPASKAATRAKKGNGRRSSAARQGSKTATVLGLIERPKGATLAELMQATGWQAHSVRGFISGAVSKKMGLQVASTKRDDGQRVYTVRK